MAIALYPIAVISGSPLRQWRPCGRHRADVHHLLGLCIEPGIDEKPLAWSGAPLDWRTRPVRADSARVFGVGIVEFHFNIIESGMGVFESSLQTFGPGDLGVCP